MKALLWFNVLLCVAIVALLMTLLTRLAPTATGGAESLEERLALAGALHTKALPDEALAEYAAILASSGLSKEKKANIAYLAGNIAFENLDDPIRSLAFYHRSMFFNPEPSKNVKRKMTERIAACQDRLGRSLDASATLSEATRLPGKESVPRDAVIVAKIGDRQITLSQIDAEIQRLPEYLQTQLKDPARKLDFTRSFVAQRILARKARRQGLDRDPLILKALAQSEQSILTNALLEKEISGKISISPSEIQLQYETNKEDYRIPLQIKVAHIQFNDEETANATFERLDKGEDFAKLAAELSVDEPTCHNGGELGWVIEGPSASISGWEDSANQATEVLKLQAGHWTSPIESDRGFHLFKCLEHRPASTQPFEQVKQQIESRLRGERAQLMQQALIEELMATEDAKIFDDAFKEISE